ncbi:alpha/beta fold hydrolase [Streptomyces sp. NPDC048106]|uniref:alpha/beta fold hydrolase n=1 Tax=Streptomyces sp. NPDC048106 TaxID=3155750 RepID=UPI0034556799
MTTTTDQNKRVVSRALAEITRLRTALEENERARSEPIAIVGMACHVPGADAPSGYWDLLRAGRDAVTEIPADRWDNDAYRAAGPDAPGTIRTRRAGLVADVDRFDAAFFGVSAREAAHMDPQQRLFLETSWEALESAGIAAPSLAGSRTGVYVGVTGNDYWQSLMSRLPLPDLDVYALTGHASTFAAGRLSYWLGLSGPSLSVDTACSSSLVGVHLACQSLRAGETDLALAGGVNALLAPEAFVVLSQAKMLSPDGRCATFDASANGYVRSEGCGVVVLKRLSDAQAAGDRVLALVRGSAVNQDGRSSGLTVPNGNAQQEVIRQALAQARVEPQQIGYVEAHGTGTPLGDPIEVRALAAVLGVGRDDRSRLVIGSAKANVGHLEAAAGVTGLIKTVLALRHEEIPPQPHLREVNPEIDLERLPVAFPREVTPWPRSARPRFAGVSSFGASGTNAHVVLEEAPPEGPAPVPDRPEHLVTLSARSPEALRDLAHRWVEALPSQLACEATGAGDGGSGGSAALAGLAATANRGRARFAHRLAVRADSSDVLRERLRRHLEGEEATGVRSGEAPPGRRPKVAFLFTGQGAQYQGMALELYRTDPGFRADLDECAGLFAEYLDKPLLTVMAGEDGTEGLLDSTRYTQPALFAVQYALARLWLRWGLRPTAVAGHSVGEYAAACVAGVFDLKTGVALTAERARLMAELPPGGGMAAVFAEHGRVAEAVARHAPKVAVAAVNGPAHTVISGAEGPLSQIVEAFTAQGVRTRRLPVSHAFHSPLLDPMLDAFHQVAAGHSYRSPRIPLVSTLTGETVTGHGYDADYLRDHARRPVRFDQALRRLADLGCRTFVEIGPSPHLSGMARTALPGEEYRWIASLRRDHGDWRTLLDAVGALHVAGTDVDWSQVDGHWAPRTTDVPTYPFQRRRHWYVGADGLAERHTRTDTPAAAAGTLVGSRLSSPLADIQFQAELSPKAHPCLTECVSGGVAIVNAGFYLESAVQAAEELWGGRGATVRNLVIPRALVVPERGPITTQLVLSGEDFTYHSRSAPTAEWELHARGVLGASSAERPAPPTPDDLDRAAGRCTTTVSAEDFYADLRARGLDLGPSARWLSEISRRDGEVLARLRPAEPAEQALGYRLHPGVVDSALQTLFACRPHGDDGQVLIMVEMERYEFFGHDGGPLLCHTVVRDTAGSTATGDLGGSANSAVADVDLCTPDGRYVARITGVHVRAITSEALAASIASAARPAAHAAGARDRRTDPVGGVRPEEMAGQIRAGREEDVRAQVRAGLAEVAALVLGGAADDVDRHGALSDQGMDSLLAVELKERVAGRFGASPPTGVFLDGPSLVDLEDALLDALRGHREAQPGGSAGAPRPAWAAGVERPGPGGTRVTEYGDGTPVVFVHGGVFGGLDSWQAQLPLAKRWRLLVVSRLNYDRSAPSDREDHREDGRLLAELLTELREFGGAHVVAQSYGTLGALHAAAAVPEAVRSLTLVESAASALARGTDAVDHYEKAMRDLVADPPGDVEAFFRTFFAGIEPTASFPSPLPTALRAFAERAHRLRVAWPWEAEVPVAQVRAAGTPALVITGGQRPLFEAIGDALAEQLGARRAVVPGGHGTQNVGAPFNTLLTDFLDRIDARTEVTP